MPCAPATSRCSCSCPITEVNSAASRGRRTEQLASLHPTRTSPQLPRRRAHKGNAAPERDVALAATFPGNPSISTDAKQPVETSGDYLDMYLRASDLDELTNTHLLRFDATKPNLHLRIVPVGAWPFTIDQHVVPLLVGWLDLADRGDRAERLVREQLLRGLQ